MTPTVATA